MNPKINNKKISKNLMDPFSDSVEPHPLKDSDPIVRLPEHCPEMYPEVNSKNQKAHFD